MDVLLKINGRDHRLNLDVRVTLLDALRETLGLTDTKKGCESTRSRRTASTWAG